MQRVSEKVVSTARSLIGAATYQLGCDPKLAPTIFDCSTLTQFVYGQVGIALPRFSYQQWAVCEEYREIHQACPGDLVFCKGYYNRADQCPAIAVGHVGLVTNSRKIVHATHRRGVVEDSLESFLTTKNTLHSCLCAGSVLERST